MNINTFPYDLIGKRFGKLIVDSIAYTKDNRYFYTCKCDCGNICIRARHTLRSGEFCSCGCAQFANTDDMINKKFGKLTLISLNHVKEGIAKSTGRKHNTYYYNCKCECGNEIIVERNKLKCGYKTSCGKCIENTKKKTQRDILSINFISDTQYQVYEDNKIVTKRLLTDPHDILNLKFDKLTPIEIIGVKNAFALDYEFIYKCICDCGKYCERSRKYLIDKNNIYKSCDQCSIDRSNEAKYNNKTKTKQLRQVIHFLGGKNES